MASLDDKSVYDQIFWSHVVENVWVYSLQAGLWCVTTQNVVTTQIFIKLQHFALNVESYKNEMVTIVFNRKRKHYSRCTTSVLQSPIILDLVCLS